ALSRHTAGRDGGLLRDPHRVEYQGALELQSASLAAPTSFATGTAASASFTLGSGTRLCCCSFGIIAVGHAQHHVPIGGPALPVVPQSSDTGGLWRPLWSPNSSGGGGSTNADTGYAPCSWTPSALIIDVTQAIDWL